MREEPGVWIPATPSSLSPEAGAPRFWPPAARALRQWAPRECLLRPSCCAGLSRVPVLGSVWPWPRPWPPRLSHLQSARSAAACRWRPAPVSGSRESLHGAGYRPPHRPVTPLYWTQPAAWGRPRAAGGPGSEATPAGPSGGQQPAGMCQAPRQGASRHPTQRGYAAPARRGSPCGSLGGPPQDCVCAVRPSCQRPERLPASLPTARV